MIDAAVQLELHEQLLGRDPTAPARLADTLFLPLVENLRRGYPRIDPDLITMAAIDAWAGFVKAPQKFDPSKGKSLFGYLKMAAEGDLLNALDHLKREKKRLRALDALRPVEVENVLRNRETATEENPLAQLETKEWQRQVEAIYGRLDELFPDAIDRQLAELVLTGERRTETYTRILGLQHLSRQDQQREVKRHKDRIKKRLQRYGQILRN